MAVMTPPNGFPSYTKIWNSTSTPSISPTRAELSAKGKSIVITGGGTGIGAQIALSFAKAGASFIGLIGRREDKLVSSTAAISAASPDTKVSYATANILNATELDAAFKKFHDEFGEINVLVSNAGFASKITDMLSAELDDWWMGLEVNVKGTFNTIRSFMRHAAPNPILLNITSGIGHLPVIPGVSSYASSKIANAKLVEYAGSEIPGLHVVNVQPGVIETDLNSLAPGLDSAELPGDFCVWLTSPEAKFLKGKFVWANWDVEELKARADEIEKNTHELRLALQGPHFL